MNLGQYLREHRGEIVKQKEVLVQNYDPTYGLQEPSSVYIDLVDFDALVEAIDDFHREFK